MARRSKRGSRGWGYGQFVAGLGLGLVLALWVYPMLARWWTEPLPDILATNPSSSPRFDFYDILERGEEVVEDTRAASAQAAAQPVAEADTPQPRQTEAEPLAKAATATPQPADGAAQPSSGASSVREPQSRAAPAPVAAPGMYVLQLGAFTRQREAESLKARLALVGMNARIQPVRVDRQTYYRVRVGPTSDLEQLNADRARLQEHRFDSILLKLVQ